MATFTCKFSARIGKHGKVAKKFVVKAADQYAAVDKIISLLGSEYDAMTYPAFQFGKTKGLMSSSTAAVLAGAGPEES